MKVFAIIALVVVVACNAFPQKQAAASAQAAAGDNGVSIAQETFDIGADGGYKFNYELSDGEKREEQGTLVNPGENATIAVKGSYSYVAPDGITYSVNYVADDKGFRPEGAHIPKA